MTAAAQIDSMLALCNAAINEAVNRFVNQNVRPDRWANKPTRDSYRDKTP
jgi:curli biogenesis system outer membrane secretion channel CsgG